ncbi:MDR family MFS transporter [Neorhizobium sp. NCHU2750]|uniref:MDR family MFS transporter n=1 Tax=Neorhizobium sp. NCHU2750 TaxID=1825976 RepID=UPI000EB70C4C|nr:MFS transporter [Neorhizobium sp. NCHU2750]
MNVETDPIMLDQPASTLTTERARPNFRVIALIIASAMLMENIDATVLATALPTMARDFGVDAPAMSVALTSYLLSLAIFIPASGRIADNYGSRTVFRAAIVLFIVGSVCCVVAPTLPALVAARLLQGVGGAMMMPVGRLVLMRSVERKDMVSALSWLLIPALAGPIIGPPLGGLIVTYLDWRWIFYINVPIGVVGVIAVSIFIEDFKGTSVIPFDWIGFFLSGISLGALLFGFEFGSHVGQGWMAIGLVAVGVLCGLLYLRHARRHPAPILDFSLMKVPSFGTSVIAGSLTRITQGAHPFLLPLLFQIGFGYSAAEAGQMVAATAIGALVMKPFAKPVYRYLGFRTSLAINGVLGTAGYAVCALFRPDWPTWLMFVAMVLGAFFMSFQFMAYNTIAYDEIPPERMSSATSFYSSFQQLMLSLGICIGALAIRGSMAISGNMEPQLNDFSISFIVVTTISLCATAWNLKFHRDAGAEISGHPVSHP